MGYKSILDHKVKLGNIRYFSLEEHNRPLVVSVIPTYLGFTSQSYATEKFKYSRVTDPNSIKRMIRRRAALKAELSTSTYFEEVLNRTQAYGVPVKGYYPHHTNGVLTEGILCPKSDGIFFGSNRDLQGAHVHDDSLIQLYYRDSRIDQQKHYLIILNVLKDIGKK